MTSSFESKEVVSEPGAGITITALRLTPEARQRLCTGGVRLPAGGMTSEDNWESIRQAYDDAIRKAERERVLAAVEASLPDEDAWCDGDEIAVRKCIAKLRGEP